MEKDQKPHKQQGSPKLLTYNEITIHIRTIAHNGEPVS